MSAERTGRLDLHNRSLSFLPMEIFSSRLAPVLEVLDLSGNRLRQLPAEIGNLANLKELHLDDNDLVNLPQELLQLRHLRAISLEGNSRLDAGLRKAYEQAMPVMRTNGKDAGPVLAYIASQAAPPPAADARVDAYEAAEAREEKEREYGYEYAPSPSHGRQERDAPPPHQHDDEYLYAQMRARAAERARAAASEPAGYDEPAASGRGYERDDGYGSRAGYNREDVYGSDAPRGAGAYDREYERDAYAAAPSGSSRAAESSASSRKGGYHQARAKESPFYRDDNMRMESRTPVGGNTRADASNMPAAGQQSSYAAGGRRGRGVFQDGGAEMLGSGRRPVPSPTNERPSSMSSAPFATDSNAEPVSGVRGQTLAQRREQQREEARQAQQASHERSNSGRYARRAMERVGAPFGTDLNHDSIPAPRRGNPDAVSASGLSNPWAADDAQREPVAAFPGKRGVRMVGGTPQASTNSTPFGVVPGANFYESSSRAAAQQVREAADMRSQHAQPNQDSPSSNIDRAASHSHEEQRGVGAPAAVPSHYAARYGPRPSGPSGFSAPFARDTDAAALSGVYGGAAAAPARSGKGGMASRVNQNTRPW